MGSISFRAYDKKDGRRGMSHNTRHYNTQQLASINRDKIIKKMQSIRVRERGQATLW